MSDPRTFAPGHIIAENVELVRLLGDDGSGAVWLARHQALNVDVAVKFISDGREGDEAAVAHFLREARALARVTSPHVVRVFDATSRAGVHPYIILEHFEGESLRSLIARGGPLSVANAITVVRQIGSALDKAHAAGVVHRNVTPEHIFVTEVDGAPFVKVLDFGLAIDCDACDSGIASSRDTGRDVEQLASLAFLCLTGAPPARMSGDEAPSVRHMRPDLPLELDAVFARAFHPRSIERFPTCQHLSVAFALALVGRRRWTDAPKHLRETSRAAVQALATPSARRPMLVGALAGVAALAAMVILTTRTSSDVRDAALSHDDNVPVGVATLTQATVPADPMLVPADAGATTSATVFVPEGSDPDLPVQAP